VGGLERDEGEGDEDQEGEVNRDNAAVAIAAASPPWTSPVTASKDWSEIRTKRRIVQEGLR